MLCCLCLALTFVPTAHAATTTPHHTNACVLRGSFQNVYDSYDHNEGVISIHYSICNNTVWGTFLSNTNAWSGVKVSLFSQTGISIFTSPSYGYAANTNFNSPTEDYGSPESWMAEVRMVDNASQIITTDSGYASF
jgi:hypothetical protein